LIFALVSGSQNVCGRMHSTTPFKIVANALDEVSVQHVNLRE